MSPEVLSYVFSFAKKSFVLWWFVNSCENIQGVGKYVINDLKDLEITFFSSHHLFTIKKLYKT